MKKNILIIGISSGIGLELAKRYIIDGYVVIGTYRTVLEVKKIQANNNLKLLHLDTSIKDSVKQFLQEYESLSIPWDVLISMPSLMLPVKKFFDAEFSEWEASVNVNLIDQFRVIHSLYHYRNKNIIADIVFFSSGGINNAVTEMSAYVASKIMAMKLFEYINAENSDINPFVVGPGWTKTKTHNSLIDNLPSEHPKHIATTKFIESNEGTSFQDIYDCIKWLIKQGKSLVGGRNFSVVHDPWKDDNGAKLIEKLQSNDGLYKLKRYGNDWHK
jgi:NAD(P)-dependent dehydrogenase (short-subunit alcohol dehydrogenase family)